MVEEMMLLANCTVAEHILMHFPSVALLRRHPTPPPRQFEPLLAAAAAAGISLDTSSSKVPCLNMDDEHLMGSGLQRFAHVVVLSIRRASRSFVYRARRSVSKRVCSHSSSECPCRSDDFA